MNLKKLFFLSITLPCFAACSSATPMPTASEINAAMLKITGQDGRACIRVRDISGYSTIDGSVLSVSNKFRNHFIMVTSYRCPSIESGTALVFKSRSFDFCGGGRGFVHGRGDRCQVQSVFEFENQATAFAAHEKAQDLVAKQREAASRAGD